MKGASASLPLLLLLLLVAFVATMCIAAHGYTDNDEEELDELDLFLQENLDYDEEDEDEEDDDEAMEGGSFPSFGRSSCDRSSRQSFSGSCAEDFLSDDVSQFRNRLWNYHERYWEVKKNCPTPASVCQRSMREWKQEEDDMEKLIAPIEAYNRQAAQQVRDCLQKALESSSKPSITFLRARGGSVSC